MEKKTNSILNAKNTKELRAEIEKAATKLNIKEVEACTSYKVVEDGLVADHQDYILRMKSKAVVVSVEKDELDTNEDYIRITVSCDVNRAVLYLKDNDYKSVVKAVVALANFKW